jgi:hypothetical protein
MNMSRNEIEAALAAVIDAESAAGIQWWPGSEMASIVYRRWSSFPRRIKLKHPTDEDRAFDLAKGLRAHFEPDTPYTPMSEWLYLSRKLIGVIQAEQLGTKHDSE